MSGMRVKPCRVSPRAFLAKPLRFTSLRINKVGIIRRKAYFIVTSVHSQPNLNIMNSSRLFFISIAMSLAVFTQAQTIIMPNASTDAIESQVAAICDSFNITPIVQTHACHGPCLGVVQLEITGGTPPYNYQWSTGSTEPVLGGLCDGEYSVTVSDGAKCFDNTAVTVNAPDSVIVGPGEIIHATHGQSNGQVTIAVTGGTAPYRYTLEESKTYQESPTFPDLPAGMYAATVVDANSCTGVSDSFEIQNLLGISELDAKVRWYPNPASSHLFVESDVQLTVDVQDIRGNTVVKTGLANNHQIMLSHLIPGLYLMKISDTNQQTYVKLIVE